MTDLLELAGRCERATGPDEVLDGMIEAELHIAFNLDVSQFVTDVPIEWEADEETGSVSIYIAKRKFKRYVAPAYTASLDAAMTLVPWEWVEEHRYIFELCLQSTWVARFDQLGDECGHGGTIFAEAVHPALALCAAALKARAASVDRSPKGQDAQRLGRNDESAVPDRADAHNISSEIRND